MEGRDALLGALPGRCVLLLLLLFYVRVCVILRTADIRVGVRSQLQAHQQGVGNKLCVSFKGMTVVINCTTSSHPHAVMPAGHNNPGQTNPPDTSGPTANSSTLHPGT